MHFNEHIHIYAHDVYSLLSILSTFPTWIFKSKTTKREKIQILLTISRKISILPYLNFDLLSQVIPHNYSGADLVSLTKEAVLINSDKRIGYISLVNSTNGLFNILN